ncbi:MAG: restriction endonuclease [Candidatus Korobacteraceae bacterium]
MKASEAFEQRIHRIYELLAASGAAVTWDDHIPDPDNPTQRRQIDVTLKLDGKLTLIECRKHRARQDVQWIEELIGRRVSLGADSVIAVSESGFTSGALAKAKKHGIIPRELKQLTDREVVSWGRQVDLTLYFYQYSDLDVSLLFSRESIAKLDPSDVRAELPSHPCLQSLFGAAAQQLGRFNLIAEEQRGRKVEFELTLRLEDFRVCAEPVYEVVFRGNARLVAQNVVSPAVCAYGVPGHDSGQEDAVVEIFALGETSIVHDEDRISVLIDLSQLKMPPFCQFRFFRLNGEREMNHESVEFYGLDKLGVSGKNMNVSIYST